MKGSSSNKRRILPKLLKAGVLIIFIIGVVVLKRQHDYKLDVDDMYAVASILGLRQGTEIQLYHDGDFLYDVIVMLFTTTISRDEFAERVNGSNDRYTILNHYGPFTKSITYGGEGKHPSTRLKLSPRQVNQTEYSRERLLPVVETWFVRDRRYRLTIIYAETDEINNVWTFDDVPLSGNIVEITLDRTSYFPRSVNDWISLIRSSLD